MGERRKDGAMGKKVTGPGGRAWVLWAWRRGEGGRVTVWRVPLLRFVRRERLGGAGVKLEEEREAQVGGEGEGPFRG